MKAILVLILCLPISVSCVKQAGVDNSQAESSAAETIEKVIAESGIAEAKRAFRKMQTGAEGDIRSDEEEFIELAHTLKSTGHVQEAIEVLLMTIEIFPESSKPWFLLGQAYVRALEREKAIACYETAGELDPNDNSPKEEMGWIELRLANARHETREIQKYKPGENTGLQGPYLGQRPPGLEPKKFATGIVSIYGSNENTITFSPDGKEIYFGSSEGIQVSRLTADGWIAPEETGIDGYEMFISPKSGRMYYSGYSKPGIWMMDRSEDGWSEPRLAVAQGMFSTVTDDETLYTTVFSSGVYIGRYVRTGGKYGDPEILGPEVNSDGFDAHPNIARDESFVVFDSDRPEGRGFVNLYIAFRKPDGNWSSAVYLGDDINMEGSNNCSTLSPDGKYLFFTSHHDIYWVDAKVLEDFRTRR